MRIHHPVKLPEAPLSLSASLQALRPRLPPGSTTTLPSAGRLHHDREHRNRGLVTLSPLQPRTLATRGFFYYIKLDVVYVMGKVLKQEHQNAERR